MMVLERSNSEVRRLSAVYLVLQGYQGLLLLLLLYSKMLAEVVHRLESDWLYLVLNLLGCLHITDSLNLVVLLTL